MKFAPLLRMVEAQSKKGKLKKELRIISLLIFISNSWSLLIAKSNNNKTLVNEKKNSHFRFNKFYW